MCEAHTESLTIAGVAPHAVLRPESAEGVRSCLLADDGLTLVVAGGRTQVDLGGPPRSPFGLLDVARAYRGDVQHQREDLTAIVPAATTLGELAAVLAAQGQRLPVDAPLAEQATIGGLLAVGVGGPLQSWFGLPRDYLLGATVLRADGVRVRAGGRVVKNVSESARAPLLAM